MGIYESECREWTDEMGNNVLIVPFLPDAYIDNLSRELSEKYDISSFKGDAGKYGQSEVEGFVKQILFLNRALEEIVGFEEQVLNKFAEAFQAICIPGELISRGYLRTKLVRGANILFPNEKMLIQAGIEKRKSHAISCY